MSARRLRIGLIGDHDESVPAHRAIPVALSLAARHLGLEVTPAWYPTADIGDERPLVSCHGLWCVPASPYRSMDGALRAVRFARESPRPFLGTCGGFQHAVIEYARNVMGWHQAEHAETAPGAGVAVIAPLQCALVETTDSVYLKPGSRLHRAYGRDTSTEAYRCSYGINPDFRAAVTAGPLTVTAWDDGDEVRGLELSGHPFYVLTLFQPERAALDGALPPVVTAFVAACARHARGA
jgi:CTP synthase (UTP-ammonia lyase)